MSPIAPPVQLESIPVKKQRKSRKPPAIKSAVVARRAQGATITSISNDLGITRNTARGIIQESDIDRQMQDLATQSVELVPEALRVARFRLAANSESMAIETLKSTIWPLNGKNGKAGMRGDLMVNIQNLIQPAQSTTPLTPIESAPVSVNTDAIDVTPSK